MKSLGVSVEILRIYYIPSGVVGLCYATYHSVVFVSLDLIRFLESHILIAMCIKPLGSGSNIGVLVKQDKNINWFCRDISYLDIDRMKEQKRATEKYITDIEKDRSELEEKVNVIISEFFLF
ncbi:hypothetical protein DICVIV_13959 [Dictyocaulus viviparus]|uniref:Uncharacterized protein n=1 Tax=Dictyocaulus viviparus TaxID=29172 RepID=A0A0D8X6H3_DICVI|nr:hypothetical protein DICVIV_13959 [Dictyocaulus viviparus]